MQTTVEQKVQLGYRYVYVVTALLISTAWITHHFSLGVTPIFPVDDAYITLRNAELLRGRLENGFVGTPAMTGSTSAVHTVAVYLFSFALPSVQAMDATLWLGIGLYALGVVRLAQVNKAPPFAGILLMLVSVSVGRMPHQLLNGLETGLTLAAITWTLASLTESRRHFALPFLCGMLPSLRPELVVFSFLMVTLRIVRLYNSETQPSLRAQGIGLTLMFFLAGIAPSAILYWSNTGLPYPSTMMAKRAFFAEGGLPPDVKLSWMYKELKSFVGVLGIFVFSCILVPLTVPGRIGISFFLTFLGAYYLQFPGALAHYDGRYLYIFIPMLLHAVASVWQREKIIFHHTAYMLLALSLIQSTYFLRTRWNEHIAGRKQTNVELAGVAKFCRDSIPPSEFVLIHDAGYISWATQLKLVDFVGLKTPSSSVYHIKLTQPSAGRKRVEAISRIAQQSGVRYLVMLNGWDNIFHVTSGLQEKGWQLKSIRHFPEHYEIPEARRYSIYEVKPPSLVK